MNTFVYVDFYNLMFRNAYTTGKTSDLDDKIGMMMHSLMNSLLMVQKKFKADHIIVCKDNSSWRKTVYPKYKLNRVATRLKKPIKEQLEDDEIKKAADDFFEFFRTSTGMVCVSAKGAEADDIIGTMIIDNPSYNHIILSTDTDFYQLVTTNVLIYDPTGKKYITKDGIFDDMFNPIIDSKTKLPKVMGEPEWVLFKKCIRGDSADNIMTAYPRIREKGTSKKAGIREAYEDRHDRKYAWFEVMNHEWTDGLGNKFLVLDRYNENKHLIDLKNTPEDIRTVIRQDVYDQFLQKNTIVKANLGFSFLKFCSRWSLKRIAEQSDNYMSIII